jgi:hypothetical protein
VEEVVGESGQPGASPLRQGGAGQAVGSGGVGAAGVADALPGGGQTAAVEQPGHQSGDRPARRAGGLVELGLEFEAVGLGGRGRGQVGNGNGFGNGNHCRFLVSGVRAVPRPSGGDAAVATNRTCRPARTTPAG